MTEFQKRIIEELGVNPFVNYKDEIKERINFLKKYLLKTGKKGYTLSISGGQDSLLAGKLAQLTVEQLRKETNMEYTFIAIRLPYGNQHDENDAQLAIDFIKPDRTININIKEAVDASVNSFKIGSKNDITDYLKGNIKARERMKVHYDIAGYYDLLVIGTDHAAEAVMGFFTKYGDGGSDILPLAGLNKRQGRGLLEYLGAPKRLCHKLPTADLLDKSPGRSDEDELGVSYNFIDDYLEGKPIPEDISSKIENKFINTEHKRRMPVSPRDKWWLHS